MSGLSLLLLSTAALSLPTVVVQQPSPHAPTSQAPAGGGKKQAAGTAQRVPLVLPKEINVIIKVEALPGISNPKSFWEGTYAIRVADWSAVVEKTKSRGDMRELGEVLSQLSSPRRSLLEDENRSVRISVPVTGALLTRLQQQPQNPQAFLLRSTVRLFDAELGQNFAFEVNRIWQLKLFPDGEANITIKIEPDGRFTTWGPVPKALPPGYSIGGPPPTNNPGPTKP